MSIGGFQDPLSRAFGILDQSYGTPQVSPSLPPSADGDPLGAAFGQLDQSLGIASPAAPIAAPQVDEATRQRRALIEKYAAEGIGGSIPDGGDYLRDEKGALLIDPKTGLAQQNRIALTPDERLLAAKTYYGSKIGQGNLGGVEGGLWYMKNAPVIGGIMTAKDAAHTASAFKAIRDDIENGTNNATELDYLQAGRAIAVQEESQRPQGFMQQVGEGIYKSAGMAGDFIVSGGAANIGKVAASTAAKKVGQQVVAKAAGNTVGRLAQAGIQAAAGEATRMAMPNITARAIAGSIERGTDRLDVSDAGEVKAQHLAGDTPFAAIVKGFGATYAENLSEASGGGIGRLAKIVGKTNLAKQVAATNFGQLAKKLASGMRTPEIDGLRKAAMLDGLPAELAEERVNEVLQMPIDGPTGVIGMMAKGDYEGAARQIGVEAATIGATIGTTQGVGKAASATANAVRDYNLEQREGELRRAAAGTDQQKQAPVTGPLSLRKIVDAAPAEVEAFLASPEPSRSAMESSGLRAKLRELDLYDHASNASGRRQLWERLRQFTATPEEAAAEVPNRIHSAMEQYGASPLTPVERVTSRVAIDERGWPVLSFESQVGDSAGEPVAIRQRAAGWTLELPGGAQQPFARFDQAMDAARGAIGGKTLPINEGYATAVKQYMEQYGKAKRSGMKGPPIPQELSLPNVEESPQPEVDLPLPESPPEASSVASSVATEPVVAPAAPQAVNDSEAGVRLWPKQQVAADEPPIPVGHVRMYHGGQDYQGGKRWLTPNREYAQGYADKSQGGVSYVDIPADSPLLEKSFNDDGLGQSQSAPPVHFEAPEEVAKRLKPITAVPKPGETSVPPAVPDSAPTPTAETATKKRSRKGISVTTLGGRSVPAPPAIRAGEGNAKVTAGVTAINKWLVEQARAEAVFRGDDFNLAAFSAENHKNLPQASVDAMNLYLFGETNPQWDTKTGERIATGAEIAPQSPVPPKMTRPLRGVVKQQPEQAAPASAVEQSQPKEASNEEVRNEEGRQGRAGLLEPPTVASNPEAEASALPPEVPAVRGVTKPARSKKPALAKDVVDLGGGVVISKSAKGWTMTAPADFVEKLGAIEFRRLPGNKWFFRDDPTEVARRAISGHLQQTEEAAASEARGNTKTRFGWMGREQWRQIEAAINERLKVENEPIVTRNAQVRDLLYRENRPKYHALFIANLRKIEKRGGDPDQKKAFDEVVDKVARHRDEFSQLPADEDGLYQELLKGYQIPLKTVDDLSEQDLGEIWDWIEQEVKQVEADAREAADERAAIQGDIGDADTSFDVAEIEKPPSRPPSRMFAEEEADFPEEDFSLKSGPPVRASQPADEPIANRPALRPKTNPQQVLGQEFSSHEDEPGQGLLFEDMYQPKRRSPEDDFSRGVAMSDRVSARGSVSFNDEDSATANATAKALLAPQIPAKWATTAPVSDAGKWLGEQLDADAERASPTIGPAHIMRFVADRFAAQEHYGKSQLTGRLGMFKRTSGTVWGHSPWDATVMTHEIVGHAMSRMVADASGLPSTADEWQARTLAKWQLQQGGTPTPTKQQIGDRAKVLKDQLLSLTDAKQTADGMSAASAKTQEEGFAEFARRYVMRHDTLDAVPELRDAVEGYLESKVPDAHQALQDAHRLWVKLESSPIHRRAMLAVTERAPPTVTSSRIAQVMRKVFTAIVGPSAGEAFRGVYLYNSARKGAAQAGITKPQTFARMVRKAFGYDTKEGFADRIDAALGVWGPAQSLVPSETAHALVERIRVPLQKPASPFFVVPDSDEDWTDEQRARARKTGFITESQLSRFDALGVKIPLDDVKAGDWIYLSDSALQEMFDDLKAKGTYESFDAYRAIRTSLYRHKKAAEEADVDWRSGLAAIQRLHRYPGIDTLLTPQDAEKFLRDQEQKHPEFKQHYQTQQQYLRQLLLVDIVSGERSPEEVLRMMEAHQEYSHIPRRILRDQDLNGLSGLTTGAGLDPSSKVRRARGSDLPYLPILEAFGRRANNAISSYYQMATLRSAVAMLEQLDRPFMHEGKSVRLDYATRKFLQQMIVPVSPDPVVVATIMKGDKVFENLKDYIAKKVLEATDGEVNVDELDLDMDDFTPQPVLRSERPRLPNVVSYFDPADPGKRKYVFIPDPATFMTMTYLGGNDPGVLHDAAKMMRMFDEPFRKHVTATVGFVMNNFLRDPATYATNAESLRESLTPMIAAFAAFRRTMKPLPGMKGVMKGDMQDAWEDARVIGMMLQRDESPDTKTAGGRFMEHAFGSWERPSKDNDAKQNTAIMLRNISQGFMQAPLLFSGLMAATGIPVAGESIHRIGAKVLAKERGASDLEAQLAFAKSTGFFAQKGANPTARNATAMVMFTNPAIQASWQYVQPLLDLAGDKQKPAILGLKVMALMVLGGVAAKAAVTLLKMLPGSDEEKRRLKLNMQERSDDDRLKRAWFPVWTPWGGTEAVMSKVGGGPLGVAFHYGFDMAMTHEMEGGRPVSAGAIGRRLYDELPIRGPLQMLPRAAGVMNQFAQNYDEFRNQEIEPKWMRDRFPNHPEMRTSDRDPGLTKLISTALAKTGLPAGYRPSPPRIRFLAEQLGGSDATILMEWADYLDGKTSKRPRLPLMSGVFAGDYTGRYGQSARDVFEQAGQAASARNAAYVEADKENGNPGPYWQELRELGGALAAQKQIEDLWDEVTKEMSKAKPDELKIRSLKLQITETAIQFRLHPEEFEQAFLRDEAKAMATKARSFPTWRSSAERKEQLRRDRQRGKSYLESLESP